MAIYGNLAGVSQLLRGSPQATLSSDMSAKFAAAQVIVSSTLERLIGRTFGGTQSATERIVWAGSDTTLLLPVAARSISAISIGGWYDGTAYQQGQLLTASSYLLDPIDRDGNILGIRLGWGGVWGVTGSYGRPASPISVTAVWSDLPNEASVPGDITEIANYLIAERIKAQAAGPSGITGPDGSITPIRDAYKDFAVKTIIDKYRVYPMIAF